MFSQAITERHCRHHKLPATTVPSLSNFLGLISTAIAANSSSASSVIANPFPFNPGFDISAAASIAASLSTHNWEYGTCAESLLELHNPTYSVFGPSPFPVPALDVSSTPSLAYAQKYIPFGINGISTGGGAAADPAALGVAALMIGRTNATYTDACEKGTDYLVSGVPRWANGAISHRADVAELWADFTYMAPPYLAYFAAATDDEKLLEESYRQCGYYREVLLFNSSSSTFSPLNTSSSDGLWRHIVGPNSSDPWFWSTGNAWAAAGMSRVLATIIKAPVAQNTTWQANAVADLTGWIKEIIDGARRSSTDGGLLRNYLDDQWTEHGFGEISGSALLAATALRMVVLAPKTFPSKTYVPWADSIRLQLGASDANGVPHISANGTATPAVNPLGWQDVNPWTAGSPEGQNFVILMYSAWRDCIWAGLCKED
ncbi:hypothetical protein MKEN_00416000 [Mycena kentingensis (nom. inval.)]|nr:hypothetical protein MKEN_00416000 [Mycena kentingensis (nom. inval.)]